MSQTLETTKCTLWSFTDESEDYYLQVLSVLSELIGTDGNSNIRKLDTAIKNLQNNKITLIIKKEGELLPEIGDNYTFYIIQEDEIIEDITYNAGIYIWNSKMSKYINIIDSKDILYDNTTSGLSSNNVKSAIDEVSNSIDIINDDIKEYYETLTIPPSEWVDNIYTSSINITNKNADIYIDNENKDLFKIVARAKIRVTKDTNNLLIFTCDGNVPTSDITINTVTKNGVGIVKNLLPYTTSNEMNDYTYVTISIDLTDSNPSVDNGTVIYSSNCASWGVSEWQEFLGYKPCLLQSDGQVYCYLDRNDYTKDVDGNDVSSLITSKDAVTDKEGTETTYLNVMNEYPRRGYKVDWNNNTKQLIISFTNAPNDNNYSYYAFSKGSRKCDAFYDSIYNGIKDTTLGTTSTKIKLRSLSGYDILVSTTLTSFRTYAENNGDGFTTLGHLQMVYEQLCEIIMKGSINGIRQNSKTTLITTGTLNTSGDSGVGTNVCKWQGIEHWSGWEFVDGSYLSADGILKVSKDGYFNDTHDNYESQGKIMLFDSGGYMGNDLMISEVMGIIPKSFNGTSTTYFKSSVNPSSVSKNVAWGGYNIFSWCFDQNYNSSMNSLTARLMYMD